MTESFRTMAIAAPGTFHCWRAERTYASRPGNGSRCWAADTAGATSASETIALAANRVRGNEGRIGRVSWFRESETGLARHGLRLVWRHVRLPGRGRRRRSAYSFSPRFGDAAITPFGELAQEPTWPRSTAPCWPGCAGALPG